MSAEGRPISPTVFAAALTQLPPSALHGKVAEIRNSLSHLTRSNNELQPFADQGDSDCADAIRENLQVIERMNARLAMLRKEIENRGMTLGEPETEDDLSDDEEADKVPGYQTEINPEDSSPTSRPSVAPSNGTPRRNVDDEEMRRRLERLMQDGGIPDEPPEEKDGIDL